MYLSFLGVFLGGFLGAFFGVCFRMLERSFWVARWKIWVMLFGYFHGVLGIILWAILSPCHAQCQGNSRGMGKMEAVWGGLTLSEEFMLVHLLPDNMVITMVVISIPTLRRNNLCNNRLFFAK